MSAVLEPLVQASVEETFLASHLSEESTSSEFQVHRSAMSQTSMQIELLLDSIESPAVRGAVLPVLSDLLRLLDCLRLFEGHLRRIDQAHETLAMFEIVHADARCVVNNIRELTVEPSGMDTSLTEALDGIAFAIGHDLHRVFECQLNELTVNDSAELVIGDLIHGHGLLTNCLQESIVTLAQEFDLTVTSTTLFEDSKARLKESLLLCRDLDELIGVIRGWKESHNELSAASIVDSIIQFRRGSMRFLMYRDWQEYEKFSAKIILASSDEQALALVLDSFAAYLETLFRLVSSRSVLSGGVRRELLAEPLSIPAVEADQEFPATIALFPSKSSMAA